MTRLKDKLSASVRKAKAAQKPEADTAAPKAATARRRAPRAAKTAPERQAAAAQPTPPARRPSANFVEESGTALFPERVWPD